MFKRYKKQMLGIVLPILLSGFASISLASTHGSTIPADPKKQVSSLADQVRHELLMLPYYGVFDNLGYTVEDSNTIVLTGQVVRPILKSEAEAAVKQIQGVSKVVNKIEVLPLSPFDDAIRLRTYRAIYSKPGFEKYAVQAIAPIRILVKNGHITLVGSVLNQLDRTVAEMAARNVPGVFSVKDNIALD